MSSVDNDDVVCRELGIELLQLVSGTETAVARLCDNDDAVYRELGIELLQLVSGTETAVARLCARCAASMSEINRLHELVSLLYLFFKFYYL